MSPWTRWLPAALGTALIPTAAAAQKIPPPSAAALVPPSERVGVPRDTHVPRDISTGLPTAEEIIRPRGREVGPPEWRCNRFARRGGSRTYPVYGSGRIRDVIWDRTPDRLRHLRQAELRYCGFFPPRVRPMSVDESRTFPDALNRYEIVTEPFSQGIPIPSPF